MTVTSRIGRSTYGRDHGRRLIFRLPEPEPCIATAGVVEAGIPGKLNMAYFL